MSNESPEAQHEHPGGPMVQRSEVVRVSVVAPALAEGGEQP